MGRLGFTEILICVGIALLLFGAGRVSELGKGLGEGIRNFKKGLADPEEPPKLPPPEPAPREADPEAKS